MKKAAIVLISITLIVYMSVIPAFAVDLEDYIELTPSLDYNQAFYLDPDNAYHWPFIYDTSSISVSSYSRGGTSDKGIKISGAYGKRFYIACSLNNIVAGYSYVLSLKSWNYADRLDFKIYVLYDGIVQNLDQNVPDEYYPVSFDGGSGNLSQSYNDIYYSFTVPFISNVTTFQDAVVMFEIIPTSSSDIYLVFKDAQIICLDQVVNNRLRQLQATEDEINTYTQAILEFLQDMMYNNGDRNSLLWLINHNLFNLGSFLIDQTQDVRDAYEHFYDEYGQEFTIALYDMLKEALGVDEEFNDESGFTDAVSEYQEAESQLMQDRSVELSAALGSGSSALSNNNSFQFIRSIIQVCAFDNPKITAYIIFALGMGLVVLVLGRKVNS